MDRNMRTGIPPGIAAFAAYFFPFVGGLVFLALERENRFVRFHAAQSIVFWIFCIPLGVLSLIPIIGVLFSLLVIAVWVLLMYQAWRERMFELPYLADIARSQVFKGEKETPEGETPAETVHGTVHTPEEEPEEGTERPGAGE